MSPETLHEQIDERKISILFVTTALFNEIANTIPAIFADLKYLLFGGENASLAAVRRIVEHGKPEHLINVYGPTENTTFTTAYEIDRDVLYPDITGIPIGRAINGTYIRVLDEELRPVKVGTVGQLYAGGAGLARDYLNRPDLTSSAFIEDPCKTDGGARLYRTGDLVLLHLDGTIEFVGRNDDQIKIRGYRIEPVEIVMHLEEHPDVRSAFVLADRVSAEENVLVACVQVAPTGSFEPDTWSKALKSHLPRQMIPTKWVRIETWPVTANGKIDRGAISELIHRDGSVSGSQQFSRTIDFPNSSRLEQLLADLLCNLLGVEVINGSDDFFEIGGHSLLAIRLMLRVERQFGVKLQIREIFELRTLENLASRIAALKGPRANEVSEIESQPQRCGDSFPLSPMQQRLWFLEQLEPEASTYHMHQAVRLSGPLEVGLLEHALNFVVSQHDVLRTYFTRNGEEIVQQVRPARDVSLPLVEIGNIDTTSTDEWVQCRFDEQFDKPFDLLSGPLFRIELICIDSQHHILAWVMHHIISDAWSMTVFREHLAETYSSLLREKVPKSLGLSMQYGDYSRESVEFERQPEYASQLAYWNTVLDGVRILDLPIDFPRPQTQNHAGSDCRFTISHTQMERIQKLCRSHGVTLFMLLMAAYQILRARFSNQTDIAVGIPTHGRNRLETESLIGFFLNSLVIRGDLSGNPSFKQFLGRIRDTCIQAYTNQAVPFDKIVEEFQPTRDLSRNPLYDVMLNLVVEDADYDFASLSATAVERESVLSKFALTMFVFERKSQIDLRLVYQTSLFSKDTMREFLAQFVSLIDQVVLNSERSIEEYTLIKSEDSSVLPDPRKEIEEITIPSVIGRVLKVASLTPDACAVSSTQQSCTYRDLSVNARRLAGWLRNQGVTSSDVIAITGNSSIGLITAVLAVLMIGGVILPIEQGLPSRRKRLMIKQAGAVRLLRIIDDNSDYECEAFADVAIEYCLDSLSGLPIGVDIIAKPFPFREPDPQSPAYIFFTSGSTGVPKAVLGSHKGLNHFIDWQISTFEITAADRVAQLTSLSFDVFLRDIFLPLASGGTLCLPTESQSLNALKWLDEAEITVLHTVPTRAEDWLSDVSE